MKRRTVGVLALVLLVVSACGTSGDDSDSSDGGNDGNDEPAAPQESQTARGVSADEIRVGGVAQLEYYPGIDVGAKARFERANRDGGVHGRKITLTGVQDDASDASRGASIVRDLVQSEEVFAVLPVTSVNFLPQSSDFLQEEEVPYIGWGMVPGFCGSEWGYGFSGCLINPDIANTSTIDPMLEELDKPADEVRAAIQAGDDDSGRGALGLYESVLQDRGAEVVYSEANAPPAGQTTDWTPYAQEMLAQDPDIVVMSLDFPGSVGLNGALRAAGFEGATMGYVAYVPGVLDEQADAAAALEGTYVNVQVPPQEDDSPATQQIEDDLEAIGEEPFMTFGVSLGYWQADMFIAMLEATGEDLTPQAFHDTVNGGFTYEPELEGAVGPIEFPDALNRPAPCAGLVQVREGQYESSQEFSCYEVLDR
ncbi:MAG TPA: ABC transporter substrate-binding protein [Acidimicrobiales bacterium]|nr:ABC transporter substrate-binding protein [Acidimicrobiales bacterium]